MVDERKPRVCKCRGQRCEFRGTAEEAAQHEARCTIFKETYGREYSNASALQEFAYMLRGRALRGVLGAYNIALSEDEFKLLQELTRNG